MGEHVLPRDITVYQAVQQFGGQVRPTLPPPPLSLPSRNISVSELDKNCDSKRSCGFASL